MTETILMQIVVECALFFELSGDDTLNEDAAVEMLETIAAGLQQLDDAAKERFRAFVHRRACSATSDEECQALGNIGSSLGLE